MARDDDHREAKAKARVKTRTKKGCKRAKERVQVMVVHGVVRQITGEPTARHS